MYSHELAIENNPSYHAVMKSEDGGHRKTVKRYNTPWHVHFLTFSCYRRQPFFSGRFAPKWFLECIEGARKDQGFQLWAFVIMPEHVHMLIAPGEDYDIGRILWRLKRTMAHRVLKHVQREAPGFLERMADNRPDGKIVYRFWQRGGGYDRNLWTPKKIHQAVRYIHENPVRRGLVENPEEWEWSSYRTWMGESSEPISLDLTDIPTMLE